MTRRSQRAHDLHTAREIGAMVVDLVVLVLVVGIVLGLVPIWLPVRVEP